MCSVKNQISELVEFIQAAEHEVKGQTVALHRHVQAHVKKTHFLIISENNIRK